MSESSDESENELQIENSQNKNVYNIDAIHEKLEDISWGSNLTWLETLLVPTEATNNAEVDVNDDLSREMAFYTQALEGVKFGYHKLHEMKVPFLRPGDYYAEMVKTDNHMLKIKDKLLTEQRHLAEAEERRKQRELKRYSKEVQAEKLKERAKQKKQDIESVKKWRKVRQNSDFTKGEDDFPVAALGSEGQRNRKEDRSLPKFGQKGALGPSKKRQSRDSKFGFGGRKKLFKQNTSDSAADMSGFKSGKKGFVPGNKGGKGKKGGAQRPGKSRRQAMKK